MKDSKDIGGPYTVEEAAMDIIAMDGEMEHWNELVINAGGSVVNVEIVVTAVNGQPYGRQYVSEKNLPEWKKKIKRFLKI